MVLRRKRSSRSGTTRRTSSLGFEILSTHSGLLCAIFFLTIFLFATQSFLTSFDVLHHNLLSLEFDDSFDNKDDEFIHGETEVDTYLNEANTEVVHYDALDTEVVPDPIVVTDVKDDLSLKLSQNYIVDRKPQEDGVLMDKELFQKHEKSSSHAIHQGRVVYEFCKRVLSRNIAQSNVLVVTPDIPSQHMSGNGAGINADPYDIRYEVNRKGLQQLRRGQVVVSQAIAEGHNTIVLPPSTNLNSWWNNLEIEHQKSKSDLSWILLAYFIPGDIISEMHEGQKVYRDDTVDTLLEASRVSDLLEESTITYIVLQVHSHCNEQVLRSKDGNVKMVYVSGLTAARTLLDANYKIQLLASTHYNPDEPYKPNHYFKSYHDVHRFLKSSALFAGKGVCGKGKHNIEDSNFDALLFATQGLDLAIPSRLSLLDVSTAKPCTRELPKKTGRCDSKLGAGALKDNVFMTCPARHNKLDLKFDRKARGEIIVKYMGKKINVKEQGKASLWLGHSDLNATEAACVRLNGSVSCATRIIPRIEKMTFGKETKSKAVRKAAHISAKPEPRYNFLTILIDPLSRHQLLRSLPNTASILTKLGYVHFGNYSVVGGNSGPNQAALFSGLELNGRNGIKNSLSHGKDKNSTDGDAPKWLWERFNEAGYVTLKAEDICISNSNMVQSLKPNTTHGKQLYDMFCFDFDRPNCLGKELVARYLVDYTIEFMKTYSNMKEPFAAFISFVDSHEDSLTLISYIDALLVNLIQKAPQTNTVIVFLSDHGLHYGPSFPSKLGEQERAEPMLYLKLPQKLGEQREHVLRQNADYWTTPFDVYETVLDIFFGSTQKQRKSRIGTSLLQALPENRVHCDLTPGIPEQYCNLLEKKNNKNDGVMKSETCTFMPYPPSVFSFYADIKKENRPSWPKCATFNTQNSMERNQTCYLRTHPESSLDWLPCRYLDCKRIISRFNWRHQYVAVTYCDDHSLPEVHINIKSKISVKIRHKARVEKEQTKTPDYDPSLMPNILFLEIDSLSTSAAERHFPKTVQLLKRHRIVVDTLSDTKHCPTGFCSAIFTKTSVVGQHSIPNQLAALSGCTDNNIFDSDTYLHHASRQYQTWCPTVQSQVNITVGTEVITRDSDRTMYGKIDSLQSNGTFHVKNKLKTKLNKFVPQENITALSESPWLFDVVEQLGYVTLFGDEFCYEGSPFVVQGRAFPINNVDYHVHRTFCLLSDANRRKRKIDKKKMALWTVEHDTAKDPKPCINGRSQQQIAFEHIRGVWDAYADIPKFAYINSLAAHDYAIDLSYQPLGAEAYDELLSEFLTEMLDRKDANKTIIILRSDHGIQGGPSPIDYSAQIEHMNPWNNIIIHEKYRGLSIDALYSNQDKLNTGFDLYHTLRKILTPRTGNGVNSEPLGAINEWSYDLLSTTVPNNRSCSQARVPTSFCPCVNERTDIMPYFYVGQSEKLSEMKHANLNFTRDENGIYQPDAIPGLGDYWYDKPHLLKGISEISASSELTSSEPTSSEPTSSEPTLSVELTSVGQKIKTNDILTKAQGKKKRKTGRRAGLTKSLTRKYKKTVKLQNGKLLHRNSNGKQKKKQKIQMKRKKK